MGMIGAAIGGVGALSGLFGGGGAGSVPLPPQLPNVTDSANQAYGLTGNMASTYNPYAQGALAPAAQTMSNLYNNPYAGLMQSGAGTASALGQNAALGAYGAGGALTSAGTGMLPYAQSIMNTAMDPQQALFQQQQQLVSNQANAQNVMSGLGTSPYGANVASNTMANFDINWQNNQLAREATGAQAAGGLLGSAGSAIGQGTGIQNTAPAAYLGASSMPYSTYAGIGAGQNQALSQYLGVGQSAQGLQQQPISDYMSYLQTAGGQNLSQAQLALQQQQQEFQQNAYYGQMLGQSLYGLGALGGNSYGLTGGLGGGLTGFNSAAYSSPSAPLGWGDVSMGQAAQAGLASGLTYNPATGAIG
jgi:hypothetical protein